MKILIVDDHAVVRQGLKRILDEAFTKVESGEAGTAHEAIEQIWKKKWDIVILDISMPGRSGLEVLAEARKIRPILPVLVLSMYPEDQFAIRVLKSGASGYMTKESAPEKLVEAVRKVMAGGRYISSQLGENMASYLSVDSEQAPHERLSDREFEVLCMIASGKTASEIAKELKLSVKTISTYRTRILGKTGMRTNAELTHYAIHKGLVA